MENPSLEKFAERLLDLGKRNRLLYFAPSRFGSLKALAPSAASLFEKLPTSTIGVKLLLDDPLYEQGALPKEEEVLAAYEKKTNGATALFYNPLTPNGKVLKALQRKAASALLEQGTQLLYLAFLFVHYVDPKDHAPYEAPLLLLPVTLEGGTPSKGYCLKSQSDDVELNPTFAYFAATAFALSLPSYQDEGLSAYAEKLLPLLAPLGWTLDLSEVELSSFAFEKMSLYLDLKTNEKQVLANPVIQALLGDPNALRKAPSEPESPSSLDHYAFHNVFSADASQLSAIALAKEGVSFVLQGPPGTGKSQTITNIIAEALHDKKKVLFVSEKLAALNVVYENLRKANLTDFALELHSDKSDKRALFSELAKSLYAYKTTLSEEEKDDIDELIRFRNALDAYAQAIQAPTAFGKSSLYELIDHYLEKEGIPALNYVRASVSSYTKEEHEADLSLLRSYRPYAKLFGDDYRKWALKDLVLPRLAYEERASLLSSAETAKRTLEMIQPLREKASALFRNDLTRLGQLDALLRFESQTKGGEDDDASFYARDSRKAWAEKLARKKEEGQEILLEKKELEGSLAFASSLSTLETLLAEEEKGYGLFGLFQAKAKANKALLARNVPGGRSRKEKTRLLARGLALRKKEADFLLSLNDLTPFSLSLKGLATPWDALLEELSSYEEASQNGLFSEAFAPEGKPQEFHASLAALAERLEPLLFALKKDLSILLPYYPRKYPSLPALPLADFAKDAALLCSKQEDLEAHEEALQLLEKIDGAGLTPFFERYLDQGLPLETLVDSYDKDTLLQEIYYQASLSPELARFSKDDRASLIAHFRELDELQYRISRHQIAERLSEGRPSALSANADPIVSKILHEHEKKRKVMPTRYLLQNYFKTVSDLKPLFLMSPLSVATYLPNDAVFDLVVFDEASQIFPEDALGAIYRGKEAIIVGDEHQLPPTSFFLANEATDEEEEDYAEDDESYESVLDLAAAALPSKRLLWHYRSKDESLIAFSNHKIYDSSLYSFPNATHLKENGVHAHFVPAGVYLKKSRNNPIEAQATAELLFALAKAYPERSFGIVAFSESQQDAIYDAIDALREKDPSLEKSLFERKDEPLFVKNLETVQGDERDVILLSIGYAKDEAGRFYQRFGPLNASGGERRLNVAITRAKYALEVISSFRAFDLDESKTASEGVRLLKQYLLYAEKGTPLSLPSSGTGDGLLREVLAFLRSQGYEGELHYGDSLGRIELAVKEKGGSRYLLAIESDGPLFQSARTARDRDELREAELRLMGWGYYRLYSESYLKSPKRVEEEILACLAQAKKSLAEGPSIALALDPAAPLAKSEGERAPSSEAEEKPAAPEEAYVQDRSVLAPYLVLKRGVLYRHVEMNALTNKILALIQAEGPIDGALLYRRLALLSNDALIPEGAGEALTSLVEHLRLPGIKEENGFFYRSALKSPYLFRPYDPRKGEPRNPEDIPYQELANGMKSLLKGAKPLPKETLYLKLNALLGYHDSEMKERYYYEDAIQKDDELSLDAYDRVIYGKAQ